MVSRRLPKLYPELKVAELDQKSRQPLVTVKPRPKMRNLVNLVTLTRARIRVRVHKRSLNIDWLPNSTKGRVRVRKNAKTK